MTYQLTSNFIKLLGLTSLLILYSISAFSQHAKKKTPSKTYKCATYVHNLNSNERNLRDICFSVKMTGHYDSNNFGQSNENDKKDDIWRFDVKIFDNIKGNGNNLEDAFVVYKQNADIIQFHTYSEHPTIKAVIYYKPTKSWQILLLQSGIYKILSSSPTYNFFNVFDIVNQSNSNSDY
ncbi:hypothetical protein [Spirosoma linguale]|uniref:Uncharacterized protein n=1 Tax=Spirosoma linguale (strain ATCC 33905 / DSM 74 / LMG 10896 / Claus 1) TaxID=504472 RepID=D2QR11_SPILD|nr:hypothetical protein Slin_1818 [Spirosoma linguale DSM 74]